MSNKDKIVIAVPKGRILEELKPIFENGVKPDPDLFSGKSRALSFSTNNPNIEIIRVRSFDVATFVEYGAADIGICGSDVIEEFNFDNIYIPHDLKVGTCRLSLACPNEFEGDVYKRPSVDIATKYPNITKRYFESKGVQVNCIKLNGAIEIAPRFGMADYIVDLVSTGSTLKANNMREVESLLEVSSRIITNRASSKTKEKFMNEVIGELTKNV